MKHLKKCSLAIIILLFILLLSSGCHTGRLSKTQHIRHNGGGMDVI